MALSQRLRTLCSFLSLEETGSLLDVGYDHGQILHCAKVHGIGPLFGVETAAHFKQRYQQQYPDDAVTLFTGDGLHPLRDQRCPDTIILAGIGEEQIRRILSENPAVWQSSKRIIFSPSSIDLQLRPYLNQHGWWMQREVLLQERGKFYVVSEAQANAAAASEDLNNDPRTAAIGPRLFEAENPLLAAYCAFIDKRFSGAKDNSK